MSTWVIYPAPQQKAVAQQEGLLVEQRLRALGIRMIGHTDGAVIVDDPKNTLLDVRNGPGRFNGIKMRIGYLIARYERIRQAKDGAQKNNKGGQVSEPQQIGGIRTSGHAVCAGWPEIR